MIPLDVDHPRCPYCKDAVRPSDRKRACDGCMSWHHVECWEEDGRCAACRYTSFAGRDPDYPNAPAAPDALGGAAARTPLDPAPPPDPFKGGQKGRLQHRMAPTSGGPTRRPAAPFGRPPDYARQMVSSGRLGRRVPLTARLAALFGGLLQPIAWMIFGFTMIFFWPFAWQSDAWRFIELRGELGSAEGTVVAVEQTSYSEGGSDNRPGTPVYRTWFEYEAHGAPYEGKCYTLGRRFGVGDAVPVEFSRDRPTASRIVGTRVRPMPWGLAFIAIMPLVALLLALSGLRAGWARASLLSHGRLACGRLVSKSPTGAIVNGEQVYALRFAFEAADGVVHHATAKTHRPRALEDEDEELILYDPRRPEVSFPVDALPGGMELDEEGDLTPPSSGALLFALLPPVAAVGIHALVLAFMTRG